MKNSEKIILDLCGGTGAWSKPYKDAGYDVRVITLPMFDVTDPYIQETCVNLKPYGILAAPPCTMFSLARTKAKKPRDLKEGMRIVKACMDIIWEARGKNKLAFWALENPMGYLRQFLGKPKFTFDPSEFGGDYNKTTDIWGYFNEPPKGKKTRYASTDKNTRNLPAIPADYKIDDKMTPLQIKRSITNKGFAEAFFKANP